MVSPGIFADHLNAENTIYGYHDSAEGYIFVFAVNLQTLNYLQTLQLLKQDELDRTLEYMQTSRRIIPFRLFRFFTINYSSLI